MHPVQRSRSGATSCAKGPVARDVGVGDTRRTQVSDGVHAPEPPWTKTHCSFTIKCGRGCSYRFPLIGDGDAGSNSSWEQFQCTDLQEENVCLAQSLVMRRVRNCPSYRFSTSKTKTRLAKPHRHTTTRENHVNGFEQ